MIASSSKSALMLGCLFVLISACGCRLSDPIYAVKPLAADDADRPGDALIFGTVKLDHGPIYGSVHTVVLERVAPSKRWASASETIIYRVFRRRSLKNGHFVIAVPPGVWEIAELYSSGGCMSANIVWSVTDDARVASRIFVTRPGVYDIGVLRLGRPSFIGASPFTIESGENDQSRSAHLRRAVEGTVWERFLEVE